MYRNINWLLFKIELGRSAAKQLRQSFIGEIKTSITEQLKLNRYCCVLHGGRGGLQEVGYCRCCWLLLSTTDIVDAGYRAIKSSSLSLFTPGRLRDASLHPADSATSSLAINVTLSDHAASEATKATLRYRSLPPLAASRSSIMYGKNSRQVGDVRAGTFRVCTSIAVGVGTICIPRAQGSPGDASVWTTGIHFNMRSAGTNRLVVPPVRLATIGSRAFPVAAAHTWNSLP